MSRKKLIAFVFGKSDENRANYGFEIANGLWTQAPKPQRQYSDIVFKNQRIQTSSYKIPAIHARNAIDINLHIKRFGDMVKVPGPAVLKTTRLQDHGLVFGSLVQIEDHGLQIGYKILTRQLVG